MKKFLLATAMIFSFTIVNAQAGKDIKTNNVQAEQKKEPIDTAFQLYMEAVYKQFSKQLADRLSSPQWKSVLGEMNQTLYDATAKDLSALLISAMAEWNKRGKGSNK